MAMPEYVNYTHLIQDCIQRRLKLQFLFTFVVNVESVILTPARDVVAISCQANKILLIHVTCQEKKNIILVFLKRKT